MKSITVKLDDETVRDLEALVREKGVENQSDLVRQALRRFIAQERLTSRRAALSRYIQDVEAQSRMSDMADVDVDEAAQLLRQVEE